MGNKKGFTLLEVMIAIAILGVAFTVILQLFAQGLDSATRSGEYSRAVLYAREKMEELIAMDNLTEGEESGEFDDVYRWHSEIKPAELKDEDREDEDKKGSQPLPMEILELSVRVSWLSDGKDKSFEVNTLKSLIE